MFYLKVQKYIDIDKSTNFYVEQHTTGCCFYFFALFFMIHTHQKNKLRM